MLLGTLSQHITFKVKFWEPGKLYKDGTRLWDACVCMCVRVCIFKIFQIRFYLCVFSQMENIKDDILAEKAHLCLSHRILGFKCP